ncbi:putative metalloprotease arx1 [Yamadazyma tenuis]|uniref:Probable metalloprotease ARX1 n=1 Tax=Candida tenuis (strain ATCC 10573 / BCRC 21748 / CBS 615 / JCM 9827 / NBRC 10315 / NRRL Y-1498 / VKM Y-70) TaxID=590646 RepID=G3BDF7_CANTC|nr:uncharacterized protein CANTEDRAFT_127390 [Yamadazyma tenuis ATCC 10573]EGV60288.1 hypothetical protein CANTEDRAFT_127390 [Yamadazyma tenuis ATCC 10573]WEJ94471.1 putative metalloprotease arx1 [Yamadazyma tenuis]
MNQLAVHKDDENRLLKTKNVVDDIVLDKYRTAGHIAETGMSYAIDLINQMYHLQSQPIKPISQICLMVDSLMAKALQRVYTKSENNISKPTCFNVNEILSNYSPELDDPIEVFKEGDVITISLGVSVDGYVADSSHTLVIYPAGKKPVGPLLGPKADAIVANHYIKQVVTSLLGLSLVPEKIPVEIQNDYGRQVSSKLLKTVVESIAEAFNCRVVPGSEIRVIRRFLSGQNEFLQEKGYKGIKWTEADQEALILSKLGLEDTTNTNIKPAEFFVAPGEVYQVNVTVASIDEFSELGLVTTEELNKYTGLNNKSSDSNMNMDPHIFVRDFIINYHLKLKSSRSMLGKIDKAFSVFPFKLSFLSERFPLQDNTEEEIEAVKKSFTESKFGLSEVLNHNLINGKPIKILKYLPVKSILGESSIRFNDVNALKLIKHESIVPTKSTESFSVVLHEANNEVVQLTGSQGPVFCQSSYQLQNVVIDQLIRLLGDKYGVKLKTVRAGAVVSDLRMEVKMETD